VLNKVGQFLQAPPLRHIVGQVKPKLDFSRIMDESSIFIANLAKGRIGEHNAMLLGSMLMTQFFLAALRRQDRPEQERVDFFVTIDEVHNLASDMLGSILSEARKYHLSFTGATQYLNQLTPAIRSAIFGNVATMAVFRVGTEDAEMLESSFAPYCTPADLQTLGRHEFYVKLAIRGGGVTRPFHARALPPQSPQYRTQQRERVIRASRERYGVRRDVIEDQISRWPASTQPMRHTSHPQQVNERKPSIWA
jgi:DNA helicase HerA-like ATPase